MKKIKNIFITLIVMINLVGCHQVGNSNQQISSELTTIINNRIGMLKQSGAISVSYALMQDDEILFSGNSEEKYNESTQYNIGSVSKMVTTVAAMQLIDQGLMSLDTPVVEVLPEFSMDDPRYKDITIRMLMNHSSGLPGQSFSNGFVFGEYDPLTHDTFLDNLKTASLKANPGEYSVYCNDGFMLLELVIEKVSGQTFTDYITQHIFKPLNMNDSNTPITMEVDKQAEVISSYAPETVLPADVLNIIGTGGIFSTAQDLVKFAQVMNPEKQLLSQESIEALHKSEVENSFWIQGSHNSLNYGLGWDSVNTYPFDILGIDAYVKGGDTLYSHASLITIPEYDLSCAVVSMGGVSTYNQMMATDLLIQVMLDQKIIDQKPQLPELETTKESKPLEFDASIYEGRYSIGNSFVSAEFKEDGTLMLGVNDSIQQPFYHLGNGVFVDCSNPMITQHLHFEQLDENIYMYVEALTKIQGLGSNYQSVIYAQKMADNPLNADVENAWNQRKDKKYILLTEPSNSQMYQQSLLVAPLQIEKGYCFTNKIVDENTAIPVSKIPGVGSRDTFEYHFIQENGVEYLVSGKELYVDMDTIQPLNTISEVTLNDQGHVAWFKLDESVINQTLTFEIPKDASVVIYDSNDAYVYNSYVTHNTSVTITESGTIGFVGNAGDTFNIYY